MKSEKPVEIGSFTESGFETVACGGEWKVSMLNEASRFFPGKLDYVERHTETDEVFFLLEGKARLFTAGKGDIPEEELSVTEMETLTAYNVKANVWHAVENNPGTKLLIIERTDTDEHNTFHYGHIFPINEE